MQRPLVGHCADRFVAWGLDRGVEIWNGLFYIFVDVFEYESLALFRTIKEISGDL